MCTAQVGRTKQNWRLCSRSWEQETVSRPKDGPKQVCKSDQRICVQGGGADAAIVSFQDGMLTLKLIRGLVDARTDSAAAGEREETERDTHPLTHSPAHPHTERLTHGKDGGARLSCR